MTYPRLVMSTCLIFLSFRSSTARRKLGFTTVLTTSLSFFLPFLKNVTFFSTFLIEQPATLSFRNS